MTEPNAAPALYGQDGAPCEQCRAPLAGNQRYCLYCGTRRSEATWDFASTLAAEQATGIVPAPGPGGPPVVLPPAPGYAVAYQSPPPAGVAGWLKANVGVLALAGLLLGVLLVGLLLGHWVSSGTQTPAAASAPQIIRITGAGAAAPAAAAATTTPAAAPAATKTATKATTKTTAAAAPVKAPKDAVNASSLTSSKAVDNAVKKGKPLVTSGTKKLPPKDNKPAGGGSSFETIG